MNPRPQLDEDQMARMEDPWITLRRMEYALRRAAAMFRVMRCETMAKFCEEALK